MARALTIITEAIGAFILGAKFIDERVPVLERDFG
jgi:hypothetical protein